MIETERLEADSQLPWVRREHEARFRFAARYVSDRLVVDCACGEGASVPYLTAAGAAKVIAFDCSMDALQRARKQPAGRVSLVLADGCSLPLQNACVDVFVSLETIEHVENDHALLMEAARVLSRTGTFVCSTPNRIVSNPGLGQRGRPASRFHIREYAQDEFADLLRTFFSSVELYGQNPSPVWQVRLLGALGRLTSPLLVTRARQMTKMRFLLPRRWREHEVNLMVPGFNYEYIVAVCSKPKGT